MRYGLINFFPWRPHAEHFKYIENILKNAGHEIYYLTCQSDLRNCYQKELKKNKRFDFTCPKCIFGGVKSYSSENISTLGDYKERTCTKKIPDIFYKFCESSASTLMRVEADEEFTSCDFKEKVSALAESTKIVFDATKKWIKHKDLDGVCVFNARVDITRAAFEACIDSNINVVSVERSWFGDGLQILPNENCNGIKTYKSHVQKWNNKPLTYLQALCAARPLAERFLKINFKEWRAYNIKSELLHWHKKSSLNVLILPSSRSEIWGHADYINNWKSPIEAYEALLNYFGIDISGVIMRCHPVWAQSISGRYGYSSIKYYEDWANKMGITIIPSNHPIDTTNLINQSDLIISSGTTATLEAGILGKKIILVAPSAFMNAKFIEYVGGINDLYRIDPNLIFYKENSSEINNKKRSVLRALYTITHRVTQYNNDVRANDSISYKYNLDPNPKYLLNALEKGEIIEYDDYYAGDLSGEDSVLEYLINENWLKIIEECDKYRDKVNGEINRKKLFRFTNIFRNLGRRGDF